MDTEEFLQTIDARFQASRSAIGAIPSEQLGFRPAPDMMSARELALHMMGTYRFLRAGLGENDWSLESYKIEGPFETTAELLTEFDGIYRDVREKLAGFPSDAFELRVKPFGVEQKISAMARAIADHEIHHRGQLFVYLRLLGVTPPESSHGFHGSAGPD
jgi:uncharacterized damage-inducible protein DinB